MLPFVFIQDMSQLFVRLDEVSGHLGRHQRQFSRHHRRSDQLRQQHCVHRLFVLHVTPPSSVHLHQLDARMLGSEAGSAADRSHFNRRHRDGHVQRLLLPLHTLLHEVKTVGRLHDLRHILTRRQKHGGYDVRRVGVVPTKGSRQAGADEVLHGVQPDDVGNGALQNRTKNRFWNGHFTRHRLATAQQPVGGRGLLVGAPSHQPPPNAPHITGQRFHLEGREMSAQRLRHLLGALRQHVHSHRIARVRLQSHVQTIARHKAVDRLPVSSAQSFNFELAVLRRLAEGITHDVETIGRLHEGLHLGCLSDRRALKHGRTRHSVLHHHSRSAATGRDGSGASIRASNQRSFRRRHRDVMRLAVHKNGTHDANRNGNITHNGLTVVALRINRQNLDYGHS